MSPPHRRQTDVGTVLAQSYFTQKRAVEYNLTGWVRNTDNNKVSTDLSDLCKGTG